MAVNKKPAKQKITQKAGVFDVSHPGKGHVSADATSKPIIITNRPVIKDTSTLTEKVELGITAPVLTHPKKVIITPLDDSLTKVTVAAKRAKTEPESEGQTIEVLVKKATERSSKVAPPAKSEPEAEEVKIEVKPETPAPITQPDAETKPMELTPPLPNVADADGRPVDVLAPQPMVAVPSTQRDDKQLSPQQADEAEHLARERGKRLQAMIENEQYFLPINAVQEKRSRQIALLGLLLIIVLAAAWYDTALDAGLLPNMYNLPHTSFFTVR